MFGKSFAIRWMLETFTNPEILEAAAAMVPRVQWLSTLDASAIYERLLDGLAKCVDRPEIFVTYGKAMAHLRVETSGISSTASEKETTWGRWGDKSRFIRDAFMDARLACSQLNNVENARTGQLQKPSAQADVRTALKTMVVHGFSHCLSHPDNEELIWNGDLRWRHSDDRIPSSEEFDWLTEYLVDPELCNGTEVYALLALSAMHGLGSPDKRPFYVNVLIRCMTSTKSSRIRHAALRAISDASKELASITNDSKAEAVDARRLDELSRALLSAGSSDASSDESRNRCYLRLIFDLAKNDDWHKRLTHDRHIDWCISLVDKVLVSSSSLDAFHLVRIFMHVDPLGKNSAPILAAQEKWQKLIIRAWTGCCYSGSMDIIEAIPALVTVTREILLDADKDVVDQVMTKLQEKQATATMDEAADTVLPTVRALCDKLLSYK
ncbi:hypothetical protein M405DRAFT_835147, partial [Rhizopogon salebrosus TDB-379]